MGLIKKSVSDIERKAKYARIVMQVLKECHMVQDFIAYTKTENYKGFKKRYMQKHNTSDVWYDYDSCTEILGTCNLSTYYRNYKEPHNTYLLVIAYLALFHEEEFKIHQLRVNGDKKDTPQEFIEKFKQLKLYDCKRQDLPILEKWFKLKEALYGGKN